MGTVDWIIVVDDDIANLQMAGRILSKNNKRVTALKSGQALLDYTKENRPDLILLDIKMPVMDGFETLKKLREQEKELGQDQIHVMDDPIAQRVIGKLAQIENVFDINFLTAVSGNELLIFGQDFGGSAADHAKPENGNLNHKNILSMLCFNFENSITQTNAFCKKALEKKQKSW